MDGGFGAIEIDASIQTAIGPHNGCLDPAAFRNHAGTLGPINRRPGFYDTAMGRHSKPAGYRRRSYPFINERPWV